MIDVLSVILILFGLFFLGISAYSISKQNNGLSLSFAAMAFAVALYEIGYGFELRANSLSLIDFCLNIEYFGVAFMPAFWFFVVYKVHFKRTPSNKIWALLIILALLTLFFKVTNNYHHIFYSQMSTVSAYGHMLALNSKGPWYFVHIASFYIVMTFGIVVFFLDWKKSGYKLNSPLFWLFLSPVMPGLLLLTTLSGVTPPMLDLTPFGLAASSGLVFITLFQCDFLELNEKIKDTALSEIREGLLVLDEKNRLAYFNKAGSGFFHWLDTSLIGKELSYIGEGKLILEHSEDQFEFAIIREDKSICLELRKSMLKEREKVLGSVYVIQDITDQKQSLQALKHLASFDVLTNLYNRRKLMEEALQELNNKKIMRVAVLMMDIDRFKKINDLYGHLAGDEVIKEIAAVCKEKIEKIGIIGRYGGEEFFALISNIDTDRAYEIAEELRAAVEALRVFYNEETLRVTISIGLITEETSSSPLDLDELINKADRELYSAKAKGRNQVSAGR